MPRKIAADLHVHTTSSDCTFTPEEVIEQAAAVGLNMIAITDHDTLDGVAEANDRNRDEGAARRLMRSLISIHDEHDLGVLEDRLFELEHYLETGYPGGKDPQPVQRLKGSVREWEADGAQLPSRAGR